MLLPRVALTSTSSFAPLTAHVQGMTIFNTATAGDVTPGYYFNDGTKWRRLLARGETWMDTVALTSNILPAGATTGDMVYNTSASSGLPVGPVYWNGAAWIPVADTRLKFLYAPTIAIPINTIDVGLTLNLYNEYASQFSNPAVKNPGAPTGIPVFANTDLNYYITSYDTNVLSNVSIDNAGVMTYDVISITPSFASFVNVVFTVK
jgi:hypothetical protein